jgi:hypothetical protein
VSSGAAPDRALPPRAEAKMARHDGTLGCQACLEVSAQTGVLQDGHW